MFVWFKLVGTLSRLSLATLLSSPGTGEPVEEILVETGVLPSSPSELT
jgi:hypothetical protein